MGRNLVICFDGTNNKFGPQNTNVIRLVQVLDRDPAHQRLYYDPGVGTLPLPRSIPMVELNALPQWIALREWLSRIPGLAFGTGLEQNVEDAYGYLMDNWDPGDRVFIFGFSRGAYTARVLAGLLHLLGLLPRGNQNMVPYAMELFRAVRKTKRRGHARYMELCNLFRWTFARPAVPGDNARHFRVHFLGVWDTVSSVGWVWNPTSYQFTHQNPSIAIVRHALAVDERRWFFRQNQMKRAGEQDFQELWFTGVHSDVGGGYPEAEGGLWRVGFEWMLEEARAKGLLLDAGRLAVVRTQSPTPTEPWKEEKHESLTWYWWPAEFFPKWRFSFKTRRHALHIGRGRHRFIPQGSRIDQSTLRRIHGTRYSPPNLTPAFLARVRALTDVPAWLETEDEFE